jgi:hypothetical protein
MAASPTSDNHAWLQPAKNVRFISEKVQTQRALQAYHTALKQLFNTSVQLVLLSKNTAAFNPPDRDTQILELVAMAQSDCERLMLCSQVAKGIHTSGNLFRYLIFLLQKAETEPGLDLFYELASLVEVMVEGFDTVRVS